MRVERFSHVMHLTSRVTGMLRKGKTRFDALRSIFPAGTVSGAPKIRAIELVSDLEGEKRGVYAGAVGHIDFASEEMDVCIAIRTMTFTGTPEARTAYLQAGGGIVYDSVEEDEYVETINKLGANVRCLDQTEGELHFPMPWSLSQSLMCSYNCSILPRAAAETRARAMRGRRKVPRRWPCCKNYFLFTLAFLISQGFSYDVIFNQRLCDSLFSIVVGNKRVVVGLELEHRVGPTALRDALCGVVRPLWHCRED